MAMKCGTHAQVFSQTRVHVNGKIEWRQREEKGKKKRVNMKRSAVTRNTNYSSDLSFPGVPTFTQLT